jgi:ABC-type multidrug transport system ATPase subunit
MSILRMRDAAYVHNGETIVAPTSLDLAPGERVTRSCASAQEAQTLAMMAAALARATAGSVTIGEYDPRVQPVHCKRIAAFVPHDPLPLSQIDAERYIAYRAALWDVDLDVARTRVKSLLARLDGLHEAFAYPIAGALVPAPQLLVLDRPQPIFVPQILQAAGDCAILIAQTGERA